MLNHVTLFPVRNSDLRTTYIYVAYFTLIRYILLIMDKGARRKRPDYFAGKMPPRKAEREDLMSRKTDIAYEQIKNKILEGELEPLSDISEEELQKELNISRTPIREACQRLKKEGFVYIYPCKGTIVTEITGDLIREIYQMRLLNEPFIAAQACRANFDHARLLKKREALANPPPDLPAEEMRRYHINLDRDLHGSLLRFCTNRFLQSTMAIVFDHNHRIRVRVSRPYTDNDQSVTEHIGIIDAVLSRDEALAEERVRHHINESNRITTGFFLS